MKIIKNAIILYTVLMLASLGILYLGAKKITVAANNVASYSNSEIEVYKKVWSNMNDSFLNGKEQILHFMIVFWAIVLLIGYFLIGFIYYTQIKPIREMESYASEIAKGNLETALPIHRNNMFGGFTESFDLMREELKSAKERELAAEHAKRELVAELSHDLKTPVATIQATCEVLDMKYKKNQITLQKELSEAESNEVKDEIQAEIKENESMLEKVGFIANKSETINTLVQNVFRATLDDMQEIKVEPVETDSRIIENYFSGLTDYGNIILENHIPECLVYIDKLRMEQVVDNIVGNSFKYAGTDIHVSFEEIGDVPSKDKAKTSFIKIRIKDDGPGVPEEELPLVVEKYYRGSDVKEKNGYGLGLYLVNWYMEKQGGGMEYYNDNGFVVELLIKKV